MMRAAPLADPRLDEGRRPHQTPFSCSVVSHKDHGGFEVSSANRYSIRISGNHQRSSFGGNRSRSPIGAPIFLCHSETGKVTRETKIEGEAVAVTENSRMERTTTS